jgi:hypothetical protein
MDELENLEIDDAVPEYSNVEVLERLGDGELNELYLDAKGAMIHFIKGDDGEVLLKGRDSIRTRLDEIVSEAIEGQVGRISSLDLGRDLSVSVGMRWMDKGNGSSDSDKEILSLSGFLVNFIRKGLRNSIKRVVKVENVEDLSPRLIWFLSKFSARYVGPPTLRKNVEDYKGKHPEWGATFALELENAPDPQVARENKARIKDAIIELSEIYKEDPDGFPSPFPQVSVKISGWSSNKFDGIASDADMTSDRYRAESGLEDVLDTAKKHGVFVMIDLERFWNRDTTEEMFDRLACKDPDLYDTAGLVIQTYLSDSLDKTVQLIDNARERGRKFKKLRIVKGAYHSLEQQEESFSEEIVFAEQDGTDQNYLNVVEYLFKNDDTWKVLGIATMNKNTMVDVLALMIEYNISPDRIECQQLKGMMDPLGWAIKDLGVAQPFKYVPWGETEETTLYGNRRLVESPEQFEMIKSMIGGPVRLISKVFAAKLKGFLRRFSS